MGQRGVGLGDRRPVPRRLDRRRQRGELSLGLSIGVEAGGFDAPPIWQPSPMVTWTVAAIGVVRSSRDAAVDDDWDAVESRIELDPGTLAGDATLGLEGFSH